MPSRAALARAWDFLTDLGHTPTAMDLLRDGAVRLHLTQDKITVPAKDEDLDDELTRFRKRHGYG